MGDVLRNIAKTKITSVEDSLTIESKESLKSIAIKLDKLTARQVDLSKLVIPDACGCTEEYTDPIPGQGYRCLACQDSQTVICLEALLLALRRQNAFR